MVNGFSIFPHNNADFNKIMETWAYTDLKKFAHNTVNYLNDFYLTL